MKTAKLLRILLLAAAFVYPLASPDLSSGAGCETPNGVVFSGIVFFGFAAVAFFGGCMGVHLSQVRWELPRPSLSAPIFSKRSPLQFIWYVGLLLISSGVGMMAANVCHELSYDGVLFLTAGLGLLTGCGLTLRFNSRRFLAHAIRGTSVAAIKMPTATKPPHHNTTTPQP